MTIRIDGTNTAANPGITGSDTDTGLQFGTDEVKIVTGGTTAVTVDSSQHVGIGTTSVTQFSDYTTVQIDSSSSGSAIRLVDSTDTPGTDDFILYKNASGAYLRSASEPFIFYRSSELARFDGDGLKFNGDTAVANALDDYEEGSWTGTATLGGGTATVQNERYTKIGNLVQLSFSVTFTSASGNCAISGLPFAISSDVWAVGAGREDASNGYPVFMRITQGQTSLQIWSAVSSGNATPFVVSNGTFRCNITYVTG
jgi:hypothetical protein